MKHRKKLAYLSVRVDRGFARRVHRAAKSARRTASEQIRLLLDAWLSEVETTPERGTP